MLDASKTQDTCPRLGDSMSRWRDQTAKPCIRHNSGRSILYTAGGSGEKKELGNDHSTMHRMLMAEANLNMGNKSQNASSRSAAVKPAYVESENKISHNPVHKNDPAALPCANKYLSEQ